MLRHGLEHLEGFCFIDAFAFDDDPHRLTDKRAGSERGLEPVYLPFQGGELVTLDLVVILREHWVVVGWVHVASLQGHLFTLADQANLVPQVLGRFRFWSRHHGKDPA